MSYFFGVDLRPRRAESVTEVKNGVNLLNLLRLLHGSFLVTFAIGNSIDTYLHFDPKPSASDFVEVIYFVNTVCILIEAQRTLWSHQVTLRNFFHDNVEHFDSFRFVALLVLNTVYSCMDVKVVILKRSLIGIVSASSAMIAWQFQTLFVIYQMQSAKILCAKLQCLDLSVIYSWRNANLNRKALIRDDTADLNGIFGTISFFMYLKVFSLLYNVLILLITSNESLAWAVVDTLVPSLQLLTLYETARLSTRMTETCHSTAAGFVESEHYDSRKYRILRHDPYRDDFTILGMFPIHKGTFLEYLGTVATFIAVLAQFDYKLMRLLTKSQESN